MRNRLLVITACAAAGAILLQPMMAASVTANPDDQAYSLLDQALKAKNPDTRKTAVQALSLVGAREPFATRLDSMLADKDVPVRLATVQALSELKTPHAAETLRKALADRVPEVRFAAAKALFAQNDPAGREALVSVLNGDTKTSSGFVVGQIREARRMTETPKPLLVFAVKEGIGAVPVPFVGASVTAITGIFKDSAGSGRAATALLLAKDADPEVVAALLSALSDKNASVRAAAVHAIAMQNDAALEGDVMPLLRDRNQAVRLQAAACYLKLEGLKIEPVRAD